MEKMKFFRSENNTEEIKEDKEMVEEVNEVQAEEQQPTEKVGFFAKAKTGIHNAGKKIWNNRGKLGVVAGVVGTFATAAALNRWKKEADHMNNMIEEEMSEETENTETE